MRITLCKKENFKTSRWMGGTTTEMAIFPPQSTYLDRNFLWRISSATVEDEESDFSKLPDYERVLMVLDGETVLSYEGQRVVRLAPLEQDSFDGEWKTKCFGRMTDFNLMVRKGAEGCLDLIFPKQEAETCCFAGEYLYENENSTREAVSEGTSITHGLFCKEGYCVISAGGQSHMIEQGDLLLLECEEGETMKYTIMGEGTVVRAQILYENMAGKLGPEVIPAEKATFEDFKKCVFLANVQFRWAKYIVKSLKTTWFDEALSGAIKKIERFYLPSLIFVIGIVIIGLILVNWEASGWFGAAIIGLWLLLDCLIISPLIYLAFVPKPVAKHIKNIENLTDYEKRVRAQELGRNEQVDRIMRKYKNSGRNLGK